MLSSRPIAKQSGNSATSTLSAYVVAEHRLITSCVQSTLNNNNLQQCSTFVNYLWLPSRNPMIYTANLHITV